MAYTINFTGNINNDSLQLGDYAYGITPIQLADFDQSFDTTTGVDQTPVLLGIVTNITNNSITIENIVYSLVIANPDDFIMFSKDTGVNISGLIGYYAEVKFKNNSNKKAEMYSVGSEVTPSSK